MASRRAPAKALPSPLSLLAELEPAHRALCLSRVGLSAASPHYEAVDRAIDALARLAAELGHEGRFSGRAPAR